MSDAPVYWSQPNQQVVRDGEPVGIITDDPDPQTTSDDDEGGTKTTTRKAKSSK